MASPTLLAGRVTAKLDKILVVTGPGLTGTEQASFNASAVGQLVHTPLYGHITYGHIGVRAILRKWLYLRYLKARCSNVSDS